MAQEVPLDTYPSFNIRVDLDAVEYQLAFNYMPRSLTWLMDVYTSDGTPILTSFACLLSVPVFGGLVSPLRPLGDLVFLDSSKSGVEAAQADFGTRVTLNYFTRAELNAAAI